MNIRAGCNVIHVPSLNVIVCISCNGVGNGYCSKHSTSGVAYEVTDTQHKLLLGNSYQEYLLKLTAKCEDDELWNIIMEKENNNEQH